MKTTIARIQVAEYSQLPERMGQAITVGQWEIALFRLTNGEVRAIENRSPHPKGGVLSEGLVSGEFVYCPLYDWKISLRDGTVQAPHKGLVKTFPIEIEGDRIFIRMEMA
ncbi:nitrite reductase small subunit NirD [Ammoniphilus sp. CFH 90114]|uniref:nitrite reductase small subunit NirD n=1 Tax=Ammoniphilus sp. CFH 90114 TaxID=2493665 RepID=UPI00100F5749|nr:nitrite reductase small subunit NirD [Ammoniphilus sp. CFH 90114]RXT07260.1 nitrite reductase small subunit NirD [Ammoniphilus sp. CFH 90114]